MKRQSAFVGFLVLVVLLLAGCGGLDESEKDDCQTDDDCLTGYFCNQEGKCQKGCTADSLRCVENSVQRCMIDHWENWEDCAESEECLLIQGRAMCVKEGCNPDCVGNDCGSNGCGGHCGICPGCPTGQAMCGNECVDLTKSRSHCGSCDNACAAGQFCFGGNCVACQHECSDGEKRCAAGFTNMFQVCGDPDNDTCKEWMNPQSCSTDQVCEQGECVPGCKDDCKPGQRECKDNGWRACGDWDTDYCLEWSTVTDCPEGQVCENGECV